ncbi:MAG: hypothetical protein NVS2B14_19010 [Chamaesiphon sp.]
MTDKQNDRQNNSEGVPQQPINSQNTNSQTPSLPLGWSHVPNRRENIIYFTKTVESDSYFLVHLIGYALLIFSLIDFGDILLPPHFANPFWEYQTIGALVEHVVVPLTGFLFVFYRPESSSGKREKTLLSLLSWVSLLIGLFFILLLPLTMADTWRIHESIKAQAASQTSQQIERLEQVKKQLQLAKSNEEIDSLLASLSPQGRSHKIENYQDFKGKAIAQLTQNEQTLKERAISIKGNQTRKLIKSTVKWSLSTLISGVLFIWVWNLTKWARVRV